MSTIAKKRARSESDNESDYVVSSCDDSESEAYVPPPAKKQRRTPRRNKNKNSEKKKQENSSEEDEAEDSDVENTNCSNTNNSNNAAPSNWKSKMEKLIKQNVDLKKEVKLLKKEIKALKNQKVTQRKPVVNGKKHFQSFAKSLIRIAKLKKTRFYGWGTICVEQTMDKDDFKQLFDGKGHKIQPTQHNKPKSVKTIISFGGWDSVKQLFENYSVSLSEEIVVSLWRQGSMFRGKSFFIGKSNAKITSLSVEYNKSSRQLKLNFSASRVDNDHDMIPGFHFFRM